MRRTISGLAILGLVLLLSTTVLAQRNGGGGKNKAALTVAVTPATFSESDPGAIGTVTRENSDTSLTLTVTLTSNDTTEATVPASVEIPANAVSVNFNVTAVNDTEADGDQQVTISASATGHSGASAVIIVLDNESGEPPTNPLRIQYRLAIDAVPSNPNAFSGFNELGQLVGYYSDYAANGVRIPFLYNSLNGSITLINDLLDQTTLPEGWRFAGALDINDYGVVVGYAIDEVGAYHACAIDLGQARPGVDLLPRVSGVQSSGLKINNAGVILGVEDATLSEAGSTWDLCWTLDTGLYGPPGSRISRDSSSIDLRSASPALVPVISSYGLGSDLSETSATGVTWVGGIDDEGAPFRYPIGAPAADTFSELSYRSGNFGGINEDGDFAGTAWVVTGKRGKNDVFTKIGYRYDTATQGYTTITTEDVTAQDINNFGEVAFWVSGGSIGVFRNWNDELGERFLNVDDLIVGSAEDLTIWFSNSPAGISMNDAGIIVGKITDSVTGVPYLFSLIPESTSP